MEITDRHNQKQSNDDYFRNVGICRIYRELTSNLRKAHVTRDSIGPAIWAISVQRTIK